MTGSRPTNFVNTIYSILFPY